MSGVPVEVFRFGLAASACVFIVTGCKGGYTALPANSQSALATQAKQSGSAVSSADVSVLKQLDRQVVIGSTVDPATGAQNPYGLTVAPVSAGKFSKGDLVVCNFNAKSNVQGTGRSIVALKPAPGSKPAHVSSLAVIKGCDALALDADDTIWAADMVANDNPVIDTAGKLIKNLSGKPYDQPWGQVLARRNATSVFYESNAGTGSIMRIQVNGDFSHQVIATGFPVNHGKPGTALAPSGLSYDAKIDTLYFADGQNNTIVAFKDVSRISKDGIKATNNGMKFAGPSANDARIVFAGSPLNGPISTALLPNGNLIAGNTLDPSGKNLVIEISAAGKVLDVRNVDKGAEGALFGLAVTGSTASDAKIYFNDDNDNDVQVLEH